VAKRTRISRAALEMAITNMVRSSDPLCSVIVERLASGPGMFLLLIDWPERSGSCTSARETSPIVGGRPEDHPQKGAVIGRK
jgi:hypothetical protein